jgi:esterase/lipase superfamily enzyme
MEIPCENVRWNRGLTRREFIGSFIISACNVVELKAMEFVLKAPHLLAVGFHLGITIA